MSKPATILAADWAKESGKRAVWRADVEARTIACVTSPGGWTLHALLGEAQRQGPKPTLVAVDLALGVPSPYFERRGEVPAWATSSNFAEWLPLAAAADRFFHTVNDPRDWSISRPFFAVPAGEGSLRSFVEKAGFDFLRAIDRRCGGKPPFVVSGVPGSVGSASRELWRELALVLTAPRTFRVWPFEFEGDPGRLWQEAPVMLAEMYPRIAYAVAVAAEIPARIETPRKKGDRVVREEWLRRLRGASWIRRFGVRIDDDVSAVSNDDDFDALFGCAALLRCVLEGIPVTGDDVDARTEGDILGTRAIIWDGREPGRRRGPTPIKKGKRSLVVGGPGDDVERFVDCAGDTRSFRLRVYAEGRFLEATEIREGDASGLRFVLPASTDGSLPWGQIRKRIRDRLASKNIVRDKSGKLHILGDVVRAQIHDGSEAGLPTVVVGDLTITWEQLGELLLAYSGFGIRLRICDPGEE